VQSSMSHPALRKNSNQSAGDVFVGGTRDDNEEREFAAVNFDKGRLSSSGDVDRGLYVLIKEANHQTARSQCWSVNLKHPKPTVSIERLCGIRV